MPMSGISPTGIVDAVATIIESVEAVPRVVRDPMYQEDEALYPALVQGDGVLVGLNGEEEETRIGADGAEQFVRVFVSVFKPVAVDTTGTPSRALFGAEVLAIKKALRAAPTLNVSAAVANVHHFGVYAPFGYPPRVWKERSYHTAPMLLRVFISYC